MKTLPSLRFISAFLILLLTGCTLVGSDDDETERTYPEALDFEFATVLQLQNEVVAPDSLNTDVFVNAVIKCPEEAVCVLPDGIIIGDSLSEDTFTERIHLYVENPLQFEEGEPYRVSLDIGTSPGNGEKRFELLGYSKLMTNDY